MGRDRDGIWFRSPTPIVFQMYPVGTLDELKSVILRNMGLGAVGTSYGTREVMELLTEMQSMPDVGGSSSSNGVIPCSPIHRRLGVRAGVSIEKRVFAPSTRPDSGSIVSQQSFPHIAFGGHG
ncbi:hypothetical protein PIB30_061818 [Stylosanthes scabra]|uniref:Uncharacterized protein n=1 Tax=Stylosanthes scabra TaxID=79078 RepID=A0ABU6XLQ1_9FABA|nr:hypothetical protein [Stylosanthes scabra]